MISDLPGELARKIDLLCTLIEGGQITPDPLKLLQAAETLKAHGEYARARRCEAIARRLLPNLARDLA